jgi:hypothetical protein
MFIAVSPVIPAGRCPSRPPNFSRRLFADRREIGIDPGHYK